MGAPQNEVKKTHLLFCAHQRRPIEKTLKRFLRKHSRMTSCTLKTNTHEGKDEKSDEASKSGSNLSDVFRALAWTRPCSDLLARMAGRDSGCVSGIGQHPHPYRRCLLAEAAS